MTNLDDTGLKLSLKLAAFICGPERRLLSNYNRIKSYLVQQLQRGILPVEEQRLKDAIGRLVMSEPESPERDEALEYILELQFLVQPDHINKISKR